MKLNICKERVKKHKYNKKQTCYSLVMELSIYKTRRKEIAEDETDKLRARHKAGLF